MDTVRFQSEKPVAKRFNTCKITIKNSDVIISHIDGTIVTTLSRAQWNELANFVSDELKNR